MRRRAQRVIMGVVHAIRYICFCLAVVALLPFVSATPSLALTAFSDGFESGDLTSWTANVGLVPQQEAVFSGAWAARATGPGRKAYAYTQLSSPSAEVTYGTRFDLLSRSTSVVLLRLQTATGTNLLTVLINNAGKLAVRNDVVGRATASKLIPSGSTWHHLVVHVLVEGSASHIDVALDDPAMPQIRKIDSLGTTPIGRLQLGESAKNRTYSVAFDEVIADVTANDTGPPTQPVDLGSTSTSAAAVDLVWTASLDDTGVTGYTIYRDAGIGPVPIGTSTTTSYTDATVAASTTYGYSVDAFDQAGNHSAPSLPISVTTPGLVTDADAPTAPTGISTMTATDGVVSLAWSRSTDNVGVAGYTIYRSEGGQPGVEVETGPFPRAADRTVSASSSYTYTVDAFDAAGNRSARSEPIEVVTPSSGTDPVIAAAGDIACDPAGSGFLGGVGTATKCRQQYTSDLLVNAGLTAVLTLGDNQYECGAYPQYLQSFDLSWGRLNPIMFPAPGNHDYEAPLGALDCDATHQALGYFEYFGDVAGQVGKGYYSYDLGAWHLIALNSNCGFVGGCGVGSPQETWLRADLAAHPASCTLAYWHHPRWSSGSIHGSSANVGAFWSALNGARADIVLSGHVHNYERFAPQLPSGVADAAGIREFVVGTGGANHYAFGTPIANSEVRIADTFGVLRLTLHPDSYDWSFESETGQELDSGRTACH